MSADNADRLRELARDHLDGRSSLETYRRLRAQLLDSLVAPADGASSDSTQPRAVAPPGEVTQPRAVSPRASAERSEPPPADDKIKPGPAIGPAIGPVAGAVALGLLLACAAVFLVWKHHSHGVAAPPASTGDSGQSDPIRALIEPVLQSPDWSDARLAALNEALLEAGRAQLDAARNTDWFGAFVESVRSRLRQQQALAGAPLTPDSSPLAALAVTLGIDLAAPAQPVTVPPAQVPEKSAEPAQRARSEPASSHAVHPGPASVPSAPSPASPSTPPTPPSAPVARSVTMTAPSPVARTSALHQYPACAAALSRVRLNYCQDFLASGHPGPLLAVIPAGSFMMGNGALAQEGPVHRVTISHDFAMSVYEVSQSEFQLYCRTPGKVCPQQPWTRGDYPVVNVSWRDAQDYARWLSGATHQRYRLATEAEWEYAARAGQTGLYPSGDSLSPTDAYFSMGAALTAPAPRSMRFNANAWHLMHMVGNAREWVQDAWSPSFSGAPADGSARLQGEPGVKVVRGGCYADQAIKLRLTTREPLPADTRDQCTGIRLVREFSP